MTALAKQGYTPRVFPRANIQPAPKGWDPMWQLTQDVTIVHFVLADGQELRGWKSGGKYYRFGDLVRGMPVNPLGFRYLPKPVLVRSR
jgi:hypothetical protein